MTRGLWLRLTPFIPVLVIATIVIIFFYPFFFVNKLPIPADLTVGAYFPWHDYKWGGLITDYPVKNPFPSDVVSQLFPYRQAAVGQMKAGILPLWNDQMFAGYPLLAVFQSAALYPLNVVYFILPFATAWSLQVVIQPFLAACFTYLLLRSLRLSQTAALFGAIAYAFAMYHLIYLEWNTHNHVTAFIPLGLYSIEQYLRYKNIRYLSLLSIVVAMQMLAGYPLLVIYSLVFTVAWAVYRAKAYHRLKQDSLKIGIFLLLGIGLSAVQLLPGAELYQLSQRSSEVVKIDWLTLHWQQLLTLFIPNYFGNPANYNYWGPFSYGILFLYTGVSTVLLAMIGLTKIWRHSLVRFFFIAALIALVLAIASPISRAIVQLPTPFLHNTAIARVLILFHLSLAVVGAIGLDHYLKTSAHKNFVKPIIFFGGIMLAIVSVTLVFWIQAKGIDVKRTHLTIALHNVIVPGLLAGSSSSLLILGGMFRKMKPVVGALLIVILSAELLYMGWKLTPFTDRQVLFPTTPVIDYIRQQPGIFRIATTNTIPSNMWMPFGLSSADGYDPIYPEAIAVLLAAANSNNPNVAALERYGILSRFDTPIINLLNIQYILTLNQDPHGLYVTMPPHQRLLDSFMPLSLVKQEQSVLVFENKSVLPRAFFATDWLLEPDREKQLQYMLDPNFPLGQKIILSDYLPQTPIPATEKIDVVYQQKTAKKSIMTVRTENPGFLFVAETFYPGWRARVDGKSVPILRADYAFQAIWVATGDHTVTLNYQPTSFMVGLVISLIAGMIIGGVLIRPRTL